MGARINSRVASTFDGSTEFVSMGDNLSFERTSPFSAWAWIKGSGTSDAFLGKRTTDANLRGYEMGFNGSGNFIVELQNGTSNRIEVTSNLTFNDGRWHLFAFTYNGDETASGVTLYVDGVPVPSTINADTLSATIVSTAAFTVGARNASTNQPFAGTLDEPGIAAKELTQAEILGLWNGGSPPDVRDMSFYTPYVRFQGDAWRAGDGDSTATWTSVPGRFNGTTTGFAAANYVANIPLHTHLNILSLVFDGTNDHVSVGDFHDFERTDTFSFEFWFMTSTSALQSLVAKIVTAGYDVYLDASGSLSLALVNTVTTNELRVRTTTTGFDDGLWHHVVVAYDGTSAPGGVTIWVDGGNEALTTITNNLSASILNNDALRFGAWADGSQRFTGQMCQLAIYNAELTQAQVDSLYNYGPINKAATLAWPSLVGWWPLGGCDTGPDTLVTAIDRVSAFTRHDGTSAGSPVIDTDAPLGGQGLLGGQSQFTGIALTLDGTAQYVDCGDVANFQFERTNSFSLECWFKPQAVVSGTDTMVAKSDGTTPFQGYRVFIDGSNFVHFVLANNTTNLIDVRTSHSVPGGVWHHLVCTYDGTSTAAGTKIYLDGVLTLMTTVSNALSATILHAVSLQWGAQEATNFFQGSLAACAVWNIALTATQVGEQYKGRPTNKAQTSIAGNLVGWWPLGCGEIDPVNATKVCDYSDNSLNHGTLTGTGSGFGQFSTDAPVDEPSGPRGSYEDYQTEAGPSGRSVVQSQGSYVAPSVPQYALGLEERTKSTTQDLEATAGRSAGQVQGIYQTRLLPEFALGAEERTKSTTQDLEASAGRSAGQDRGVYQTRLLPAFALSLPQESLLMPPPGLTNTSEGVPHGEGGGVTTYYRMRGVDNGTSAYTTWTVTVAPDPNGAQATGANTTPPLVGTIVAGSGIVISSWQA